MEREDERGGAGGPGDDGHPRHGDLQVLQGQQELSGKQQGRECCTPWKFVASQSRCVLSTGDRDPLIEYLALVET